MDEPATGQPTPYVSVRFMTRLSADDPAIERIGLIVERELQDGIRREILAAIRQAVRTEFLPYVWHDPCCGMCVPNRSSRNLDM